MKTFDFEAFGAIHPIELRVNAYYDGNLAIDMLTWEDGQPEPWSTMTVNLDGLRPLDCAWIDVNNGGNDILAFLIRYGLAIPTGRIQRSGFCQYPEYRFRAERLQEIDPVGYAAYLQVRETRNHA